MIDRAAPTPEIAVERTGTAGPGIVMPPSGEVSSMRSSDSPGAWTVTGRSMRFSPGVSTISVVGWSISRRGERARMTRRTSKGRSLRKRSGMTVSWLVTTTATRSWRFDQGDLLGDAAAHRGVQLRALAGVQAGGHALVGELVPQRRVRIGVAGHRAVGRDLATGLVGGRRPLRAGRVPCAGASAAVGLVGADGRGGQRAGLGVRDQRSAAAQGRARATPAPRARSRATGGSRWRAVAGRTAPRRRTSRPSSTRRSGGTAPPGPSPASASRCETTAS